jgi:hypothetical protein
MGLKLESGGYPSTKCGLQHKVVLTKMIFGKIKAVLSSEIVIRRRDKDFLARVFLHLTSVYLNGLSLEVEKQSLPLMFVKIAKGNGLVESNHPILRVRVT